MTEGTPYPVRLVVRDDLERSRVTVLFRLVLAIPHLVWVVLWGIVAGALVFVNWLTTLFAGKPLEVIHGWLSAYIRYVTHVNAYPYLGANPYPGFEGKPGYPVDLEIDPPRRQNRWTVGFRLVLALPALVVAAALLGGFGYASSGSSGAAAIAAFLCWFAIVVGGRMPAGLRDVVSWGVGYSAQAAAYLFLLTDRYPSAAPASAGGGYRPAPFRPVRLTLEDDGRRSRLTVFFRLALATPHLVWWTLWSVATMFVVLVAWFAALFTGQVPGALHRFLARYVRYSLHITAFVYLAGNRFPGFAGAPQSYEVDTEIDGPDWQGRWTVGFRLVLALPALMLAGALSSAATIAAVLAWFASLFTGRMPLGLRDLIAVSLRYGNQTWAYSLLVSGAFPYSGTDPSGPAARVEPAPQPPPVAAVPEPPPPPPPAPAAA